MSNLKYRVLAIVALCAVSIWALFPRDVHQRIRGSDGLLHDRVTRHVPLQRGLDLQGGMYMQLEVNDSATSYTASEKADAIDRALKTVRTRVEGIGVSEASVMKEGSDRIVVQLPGAQDPERAREMMQQQAFLEFQITDKSGALEKALPRIDQAAKQLTGKIGVPATDTTKAVALGGTQGLQGLLKTSDTAKGAAAGDTAHKAAANADSLKVQPGGAFSSLVQQGQYAGQYFVSDNDVDKVSTYLAQPEIKAVLPPGKELHWGTDSVVMQSTVYRPLYVVDAKPIITGEHLINAQPSQNPTEGTIVEFTMDNEGGRRFKSETGRHVGDYMAIVLDGRVLGTPPVIQSAIGTRGQITMGGKNLAAAQDLALVLRAGALPVPLRVAQVRNIGPSLGQDSINKGITAAVIAIALVVIIMIGYYRFSGMLAVIGLILYMLYTLAALAGFDAVLTMPGLAGFVLSIGIAVDANVLIFERMREELARGKTVRTSVDEGFRHAMPAIVDSNVSTILTAAVLYQYGSGPVKGFAVTLIAGIAASLVSSIFVVRTFYLLWLNRTRGAQTLSI
jgi:preprotein translocase subunit SecD